MPQSVLFSITPKNTFTAASASAGDRWRLLYITLTVVWTTVIVVVAIMGWNERSEEKLLVP